MDTLPGIVSTPSSPTLLPPYLLTSALALFSVVVCEVVSKIDTSGCWVTILWLGFLYICHFFFSLPFPFNLLTFKRVNLFSETNHVLGMIWHHRFPVMSSSLSWWKTVTAVFWLAPPFFIIPSRFPKYVDWIRGDSMAYSQILKCSLWKELG